MAKIGNFIAINPSNSKNNVNSIITPLITKETALAENLSNVVKLAIEKTVQFVDKEKLEILYIADAAFDDTFDIMTHEIIGITNIRIFNIKEGKCNSYELSNFTNVEHKDNGFFKWDNLAFYFKKGPFVIFDIHYTVTAKYLKLCIDEKIKKLKQPAK